jgi:hypothetical protein
MTGRCREPDADRHAGPLYRGPAHCGECRRATSWRPRPSRAGGADPGPHPDITPAKLGWTADIVQYLSTGFAEYDSVGGHMAHVVENMASAERPAGGGGIPAGGAERAMTGFADFRTDRRDRHKPET